MSFWHSVSHQGYVRSINQDSLVTDDELLFAAVADGMGGPGGGEIASKIAVQRAHEYWMSLQGDVTAGTAPQELKAAILDANMAVYEAAAESREHSRMGTTLTLAVVMKNALFFAWVGDTRIYRFSNGRLARLTKDHTRAQEMLDAGILSEAEVKLSYRSKELTRYIGADELVAMDTGYCELSPGDLIIIGTDGAFEEMADKVIESSIISASDPKVVVDQLLKKALDRGGRDNITLVAARIT